MHAAFIAMRAHARTVRDDAFGFFFFFFTVAAAAANQLIATNQPHRHVCVGHGCGDRGHGRYVLCERPIL